MLSRRDLLRNSLLGATALTLAGPLSRAVAGDDAHAKMFALLDDFFAEDVKSDPETATILGLDKGTASSAKSLLRDRSPAGIAARTAELESQAQRLHALEHAGFSGAEFSGIDKVSYDCVAYVLDKTVAFRRACPFGALDDGSPYVISQLSGAYQSIPNFLDSKHQIENKADADAYLARLEAFAGALDTDTQSFQRDVAAKIVPPDFIMDTTSHQLTALRTDAESNSLVTSLARRTQNLGAEPAAKAAQIYREKVAPALDRQIAAVAAARAKATHDAGVWHIAQGSEWYRHGLELSTTTALSPDEIHKIGKDKAREISAEINKILAAQGYKKGSLAERLKALNDDPAYLYAENDEAKAQAIKDLQARFEQVESLLPRVFHDLPKAKAFVQRVPKLIEEGQALAYYEPPALDGSRPGTINFNFAQSKEWPKWAMWTTLYHEGMPGHHLQGALAQETQGLPKYRANLYLSGYGEGWALYAEQLADELGVYQNDPLGRVGMLKAQLFRAARLVVDTGMHHKRWSREQAVDYMAHLTGNAVSGVTREVDRYCVWPGQACSYMIGFTEWIRLRAKAKQALGTRYDIRDFHRAALSAGAMPLDVLGRTVDDYIAAKKLTRG